MTKVSVTLLALSLSPALAFAQVPSGLEAQPLVTITNDKDQKKTVLSILVDRNNNVAGLYSSGGQGPAEAFFLKDVERKEGVPLVERQGYTLVTLSGRLNRETQQGKITASYLVNALFGTRQKCEFEIRSVDGRFYVRNIYTKKNVSKVHVLTSNVGIKQLSGLCPGT